VQPDTWVEWHDDDIIQVESSRTLQYRVMIPLTYILVPEIVSAIKHHLLKLAFPGSCMTSLDSGVESSTILRRHSSVTILSANPPRISQTADDRVSLHIILPDSVVAKLQGSQGHSLKELGAQSGVQVNLLPGHLLHCRGSQEGLLNITKYVVGVLRPIPSGYDPDDGSEEGVQLPVRDQNVHANILLQSSQAPHIIARLKQQLAEMIREKGRRHAKIVGMKPGFLAKGIVLKHSILRLQG